MARKRHHRQSRITLPKHYGVRDAFDIASDSRDSVFEPVSRSLPSPPFDQYTSVLSDLSEVEDRREYHPAGRTYRPAASSRKAVAPLTVDRQKFVGSKPVYAFKAPDHVMVCVRRKVRDEVLHALGKTGRGSGRPRRRNQWSNVKC